jgi:hypothetical protein
MTFLEKFSLLVPILGLLTGSYLIFTKNYDSLDAFSFSMSLSITQGIGVGVIVGYLFC